MEYQIALDLQLKTCEIVRRLKMTHIDANRVICIRSRGTKTKRTIARCHALPKIMQLAMGTNAFYAIEFLELFERLSEAEKEMTIIHELLHIPKTFGGGFRHHDFVTRHEVEKMYHTLVSARELSSTNEAQQRE